MPRLLIVNADDLGLSLGVNDGILEAHRAGVVTSATLLVNGPAAEDAVHRARRTAPALGLGLHLNLSSGRPTAPPERVPSLLVDGELAPAQAWVRWPKRFPADEVRVELSAQLDRFVALTGALPDHLDSHQHLGGLHAAAFEAMVGLAARHDLPMRSLRPFLFPADLDELCARIRRENAGAGPRSGDLAFLPPALADRLARHPEVRCAHRLLHAFYGSGATQDTLRRSLENLEAGVSELMCHPGRAEGLTDGYASDRERELALLCSPQVRQLLEATGATLTTFARAREHLARPLGWVARVGRKEAR